MSKAAKAAIPASTLADNWSSGMGRAGAKYTQGIQRTTVNPMQLAAQPDSQAKYLNAVTDAVNSGRMAAALNATDPGMWKQNALSFGPSGLSAAGQKKKHKYAGAMGKWSAVYAQASAAAAAETDPISKVRASINTMKAAAGKPLI